jgi:structural maintenance of chromosome 2
MKDIPKKTIEQQVLSNRWNFAVQLLYHPMMFSIRASIIMFLFRMKDHRRRIRYSLHVVCKAHHHFRLFLTY